MSPFYANFFSNHLLYEAWTVIKTGVSRISQLIGIGSCKTRANLCLTTLECGTIWRRRFLSLWPMVTLLNSPTCSCGASGVRHLRSETTDFEWGCAGGVLDEELNCGVIHARWWSCFCCLIFVADEQRFGVWDSTSVIAVFFRCVRMSVLTEVLILRACFCSRRIKDSLVVMDLL